MAHSTSWRLFRRMQDSAFATALLIYALAAINAWLVLPEGRGLKVQRILLWPALFFCLSFAATMTIPALRAALSRHLWISYRTGFGQSVISVLGGLGVLAAAASLLFWQTFSAAHGGRYPAGAFSGYGAGMGLLLAQTLIVRSLERDPNLSPLINEP